MHLRLHSIHKISWFTLISLISLFPFPPSLPSFLSLPSSMSPLPPPYPPLSPPPTGCPSPPARPPLPLPSFPSTPPLFLPSPISPFSTSIPARGQIQCCQSPHTCTGSSLLNTQGWGSLGAPTLPGSWGCQSDVASTLPVEVQDACLCKCV